MQQKPINKLDFEEAMELAKNDPDAFEQYRKDTIEAMITGATKQNQPYLRRLQWRIDQERSRASNPVAACVKIYEMMWESFTGDYGFVDVICHGRLPPRNTGEQAATAKILSFADPDNKTQ
jgi:hypothetical protein